MKRVCVIGKSREKVEELKGKLLNAGFEYSEENLDFVFSYGGDGMFLISERVYSGIPKVLIRDSEICNRCSNDGIDDALRRLSEGKFKIEEIKKLRAVRKGMFEVRELLGVNDIVIRNSLPTEAIRFRFRVDDGKWSEVLIGDGLVVATPFGSGKGAYFHSIVRRDFDEGLGVAFNNLTSEKENLFLSENSKVEIEIVRGVGVLVADNNRDFINLERGDKIEISLSNDVARIVEFI